MPNLNTNTPHDALLKSLFAVGGRALGFLHDYIPALRGRVQGEPELINTAFTDDESLREIQCDCLFKARIRCDGHAARSGFVIVLIEHKSKRARHALLQILKYITAIAGRAAAAGKPIPPVIPLLLYHGRQKWDMPERLDLSFGEGADNLGLNLRVAAVNLGELPSDRLAKDPHTQAAFYAMLHVSGALKTPSTLEDVVRMVPDQSPIADQIMVYLMSAGQYSENAVHSALTKIKPNEGAQIMHASVAKIAAQGEAKMVSILLQQKFGPLPPDIRQRLTEATTDELETWGAKVLHAKSLQAVFGNNARR